MKKEIETLKAKVAEAGDMSDAEFDILFEHYLNNGEMPYGVAKARTGDPFEWILEQVTRK